MAILVDSNGAAAKRSYTIKSARFPMGRDAESALQPLFAENMGVSRNHAQIVEQDGKFFLEDLQSRNGTELNGVRISARMLLADGDRIGIAGFQFRFFLHDPLETEIAPRPPAMPTITAMTAEEDGAQHFLAVVPMATMSGADLALSNAQRKLQALLRLLERLGRSLEVRQVLDQLLEGLFDVFTKADQGCAGLLGENQSLALAEFRSRRPNDEDMRVSRTLLNHVISTKSAVLSSNVRTDARFDKSASLRGMASTSLMCAPLCADNGEVFGFVQLGRVGNVLADRLFDEQDLEVLASVSLMAAITVRHAREHGLALERQAVELDMKLARRVQLGLLPAGPPELPGYAFFNHYESAYEVGGDFYDYVPLPDGRLAVVVADASGKGVSAALLMAKVAGEFRYLLSSRPSVAEAVAQLNESICAADVGGRFVTLVVAVIEPKTHEVCVVNAGHLPPLLRKPDGTVEAVRHASRGSAVGLFEKQQYHETRLPLAVGSSLSLFTDGFSEAENAQGGMYGLERLEQFLHTAPGNPESLGKAIVRDVTAFTAGHRQSDDMCLICFGRLGDPP